MSAANFVGRILIGYTADRIGLLNADIIFRTSRFLFFFILFFLKKKDINENLYI